ncbi:hypothetical protein Taro_035678 [Colocasia esculenta]|uniref:Nucleotide-diphospho-sugar transferase domain-containing protein n=1 Tax=Colocasia esculenta TaxID=4460 RepID=A0A843W6D8_COLES|nr:hypothetical protein [Colocasia esculenta]
MRTPLRVPLRRPAARFPMRSGTGMLPPDPAEAVPTRGRFLGALLLLAAVTFSCGLVYCAARASAFLPPSIRNLLPPQDPVRLPSDSDTNDLAIVLENAAMVDKTVILTTLNAAWASPNSVLDLFLESFRIGDHTSGLLEHLVIVALDQEAYARCRSVHTHCYTLIMEGMDFSEEKAFMSDGYLEMMWRRIDFLRTILEMGYNFIFTVLSSSLFLLACRIESTSRL